MSQNAVAEDVGPIPAVTATADGGAVLVQGCRLDLWTSVAQLTGDGLTWTELFEDTDNTVGNALAIVLDFAAWTGGPPTLTSKTLTSSAGPTPSAPGS